MTAIGHDVTPAEDTGSRDYTDVSWVHAVAAISVVWSTEAQREEYEF
jgi:hypothetical protein